MKTPQILTTILLLTTIGCTSETQRQATQSTKLLQEIVDQKITDLSSPQIKELPQTRVPGNPLTYREMGEGLVYNNQINKLLKDPELGPYARAIGKPIAIRNWGDIPIYVMGDPVPTFKTQIEGLKSLLSDNPPEFTVSGFINYLTLEIVETKTILGKETKLTKTTIQLPTKNLDALLNENEVSKMEKEKLQELIAQLSKDNT